MTTTPPDDAWGQPPGRLSQLRNNGHHGDRPLSSGGWGAAGGGGGAEAADGRGMVPPPPRTAYTGFGHVESLWDDDEQEEEGGHQDQRHRREDSPGVESFAAQGNGGWGVAAHGGRGAQDGGREEGVFLGARQEGAEHRRQVGHSSSTSAATAEVGERDGWMWGHEDDNGSGSHGVERDERQPAFPSEVDGAGGFAGQQGIPSYGETMYSNLGDDPSSYSSSLRNGGESEGARQGTDYSPDQRGDEMQGYGHGSNVDSWSHEGSGGVVNGGMFEAGAVSQPDEVDHAAPGGDRDSSPGGDTPNGDNGSGKAVEMRSTQDLLSLFGGFGDRDPHDSQEPLEQERGVSTAVSSRGSNRAAGNANTVVPIGAAPTRAADMRRAQKESRAVAGTASRPEIADDAAIGQASATSAGHTTGPAGDWACEVCGVRGTSSSTSCRVCGAKRQLIRSDDDVVDGHQSVDGVGGDAGVSAGSEGNREWDGDEQHGCGEWEGQGWGSAAGNEGVKDGVEAHHDATLGVSSVERVSPEVRDGDGHGDSTSPSRPLSSGAGSSDSGGAQRAGSSHRITGARMQMDVGFSSDSDDA